MRLLLKVNALLLGAGAVFYGLNAMDSGIIISSQYKAQTQIFVQDSRKPLANHYVNLLPVEIHWAIADYLSLAEVAAWGRICKIAWQSSPLNSTDSAAQSFLQSKILALLRGPKLQAKQVPLIKDKAFKLLVENKYDVVKRVDVIRALAARNYISQAQKFDALKNLVKTQVADGNFENMGKLLSVLYIQGEFDFVTQERLVKGFIKIGDFFNRTLPGSFTQGYLYAILRAGCLRHDGDGGWEFFKSMKDGKEWSAWAIRFSQDNAKIMINDFIKGVEFFVASRYLEFLYNYIDGQSGNGNRQTYHKAMLQSFDRRKFVAGILGLGRLDYDKRANYRGIIEELQLLLNSGQDCAKKVSNAVMRGEKATCHHQYIDFLHAFICCSSGDNILKSLSVGEDPAVCDRLKQLFFQDACQVYNVSMAKLFAPGVDIGGLKIFGRSPLEYFLVDKFIPSDARWKELIKLLVMYGADVNKVIRGANLRTSNPLRMLVIYGLADLVEFFLDYGADVNSVSRIEIAGGLQGCLYETPLDAASPARFEISRLLAERGGIKYAQMSDELKQEKHRILADAQTTQLNFNWQF